jgi:hypothetical protein
MRDPRPCKDIVAWRSAFRDGVLVCASRRCIVGCWAATLNRKNDLPFAAGSGCLVARDGDLAGTTAMRGRASEGQCLWLTNNHRIRNARRVVEAGGSRVLAGKVGACRLERIRGDGLIVEGGWGQHDHVRLDQSAQEADQGRFADGVGSMLRHDEIKWRSSEVGIRRLL